MIWHRRVLIALVIGFDLVLPGGHDALAGHSTALTGSLTLNSLRRRGLAGAEIALTL